jgi:hypothetical protein
MTAALFSPQTSLLTLALTMATLALLGGCDLGGDDSSDASRIDDAQLLVGLGNDGAAGTVGLTDQGGRTWIALSVKDADATMRAEIRRGLCFQQIDSVEYVLNDLKDGKSETIIDLPLREVTNPSSSYIVMVLPLSGKFTGSTCGNLSDAIEPEDY